MARYWPLPNGSYSISSPFGQRGNSFHYGVDFAAADGTKIYAAQGGTVAHIGPAQGFGQWIVLDHPASEGGGTTVYGHMWNAYATGLKQGQWVHAGQHIGYVGSNGQSSGPHLHFEVHPTVWRAGSQINPLPWLANAQHVNTVTVQPTPPAAVEFIIEPPKYREIDYYSWKKVGQGFSIRSRKPVNFFLHTEEGNGTAESLARYCDGSNGVSYHYTLRDGILCAVVDTDYYSWSVLSANVFSINLCFAGSRAAWDRATWLLRERDIEIAAYVAVQDCLKYGFPATVIKPPYYRGDGISDHRYVTRQLGIGTHTDVGGPLNAPWSGFPWDVFEAYVAKYADRVEDWRPIYKEVFGID